ncbi:MAG: hypothetical protein AABZ47_17765 [Planctomycetota bacterium]
MITLNSHLVRFVVGFCGIVVSASNAQTPTFSLEAAARNGTPISPRLQSLGAAPGDIITAEIYVRDWSVTGATLKAWQATLNSADYQSGTFGSVKPKDFATTTDLHGFCSSSVTLGVENAMNAFIDASRVDLVQAGLNPFLNVNSVDVCGYRYGGAILGLGPMSTPGARKYCGTVVFEVSANASGNFVVGFLASSSESFLMQSLAQPITPLVFEPLTILVEPEIDLDIVSSFPPDGTIDARQPSQPDGSSPSGFTSIELVFNGDPSSLKPADFTVSVDPAGPTPSIIGLSPNGNSLIVTLNVPIPAGKWTTITHNDQTSTQVRVGDLPGDVNANGTSSPFDTLVLIDSITNPLNQLELWQNDINRSNQLSVLDIARHLDLLNGAQTYIVWNGQSLPSP